MGFFSGILIAFVIAPLADSAAVPTSSGPTPTAATGNASDDAKDIDADPVVCERFTELGSRLRSKKVCKRRSEWAEDRRNDRDNIERSQRTGMRGQ